MNDKVKMEINGLGHLNRKCRIYDFFLTSFTESFNIYMTCMNDYLKGDRHIYKPYTVKEMADN